MLGTLWHLSRVPPPLPPLLPSGSRTSIWTSCSILSFPSASNASLISCHFHRFSSHPPPRNTPPGQGSQLVPPLQGSHLGFPLQHLGFSNPVFLWHPINPEGISQAYWGACCLKFFSGKKGRQPTHRGACAAVILLTRSQISWWEEKTDIAVDILLAQSSSMHWLCLISLHWVSQRTGPVCHESCTWCTCTVI